MRVAAYADRTDEPAGLVGRFLAGAGHELVVVDRAGEIALPDDVGLTLHLGSAVGPFEDEHRDRIEAEARVLRSALDAGVPVLGICYGAQLIAHALGGSTGFAPVAEYGLVEVESFDPELCPPGPWVESHQHNFTPPPGARELGRTAAGPQGLAYEAPDGRRALGWQFHPEVLPARVRTFGGSPDSAWDAAEAQRVAAYMVDERAGYAEAAGSLIAAGLAWLGVR